jgi:F0F1-type ATP synthase membrane subunit b/b'
MFDATFWVAVSFVIFFVGLIYLKVKFCRTRKEKNY